MAWWGDREGQLGKHSKEKTLKAGVRKVFQAVEIAFAEAKKREAACCI